jgi:hypothetical protein
MLSTAGEVYATDNGPNATFGAASTSATTQSADPEAPDEINRIIQGAYYGHPNRSRGRYAAHENVYRSPTSPAIPGQHTPPLSTLPSSSNGIDEYRATAFDGAMRGQLLVQKLDGVLQLVRLSNDGTAVTDVQTLASTSALDVLTGPGGAILTVDYTDSRISVLRPNDAGAPAVAAYDIFPWRGRADGNTTFVIGGAGFGTMGNTTVTVGGVTAVLTSVSPTRIRGRIPANAAPTGALLDVVVQSAGQTAVIAEAFRYVSAP